MYHSAVSLYTIVSLKKLNISVLNEVSNEHDEVIE
jgi:hypothetical protein